MNWFNPYGLLFIVTLLIPNILYAVKGVPLQNNEEIKKYWFALEGIGRYGCMAFMVINIPYTYLGFWFPYGKIFYLICSGILLIIYIVSWIFFWNINNKTKVALLSITPSVLFFTSSIFLGSAPLLLLSLLFSVSHIYISFANAK